MTNKKSICFLLPSSGTNPVGGFKVVYEYANQFAENGYDVAIFYKFDFFKPNSFNNIKSNIRLFKDFFIFKKFSCKKWFTLNSRVKELLLHKSYKKIKDYNYLCATAVSTAYIINDINSSNILKKIYLIQDYEKWGDVTDELLLKSYKLPLTKIVISEWLKTIVEKTGEKATLIYNGFDFNYFNLSNPIENRNPYNICMLNHNDERKRCVDSFAALKIIKEKFPQLKVNIFGVSPRPDFLPDWYNYIQLPNKEQHNYLYNDSSIFIAASKAEGMALPPAEAMICGCALICTDIEGFKMYAKNNSTALTSPVFDVQKLANNIIYLIENNQKRIEIAKNGYDFIKQFTWEKAFVSFKQLIEE